LLQQEISRKSPKRFKLGFKPVIRPPAKHSAIGWRTSGTSTDERRRSCGPAPATSLQSRRKTFMMKFVLGLGLAMAKLATVPAFVSEDDHMKRRNDYWVSPDPFLHMARLATLLASAEPRR
jgi:hypothetical protein